MLQDHLLKQVSCNRPFEKSTIKVYNDTLAQKYLFIRNTAKGVAVPSTSRAATGYVLSARREPILSAGAFQSPQLLIVPSSA